MKCTKCNWENQENARYCANCAKALITPPPFYKRHKILTVIGSLFLVFCVCIAWGFVSIWNEVSKELDQESAYAEVVTGSGADTIALINIDGVIVENDPTDSFASFSDSYTSSRRIKKTLQEIERDETVKGVIIRVNSPGGSAAASEEILGDIKRFKEKKKVPVVSYFTDIAASGGYYVSLASDSIVANPSTITGSIGVIISYLNFQELAQKYGVTNVVYKSGEHKDLLNSFRTPSQEENEIMQEVVDDAYQVFVSRVAEGRKMEISEVQKLADGRIYSSQNARDANLLDDVGDFEKAVSKTRELAGLSEASVIEFGKEGFFDVLLGSVVTNLGRSWLPFSGNGAKVLYLYNSSI